MLRKIFSTSPVPLNTREILALERTRLANERTLLAYVRSSLYLLIGGIALLQLEDFKSIQWIGQVALIVCVVFFAIGIGRFLYLKRKLAKWKRILGEELLEQRLKENTSEKKES